MSATAQHQDSYHASSSRPNLVAVGTIVWLSSELMFFAALFAMYFTTRSVQGPDIWKANTDLLAIPFSSLNTTVLVLSSVTCQFGVFAAERFQARRTGKLRNISTWGMREWFALTFLMGAFFIAGQVYEYAHLVMEGITLSSNAYGSVFYITTGFHGLHVTGGLLAFLIVLIRTSYARTFGHKQATTAIVVSYYWHFVDVVWIALFASIYLVKYKRERERTRENERGSADHMSLFRWLTNKRRHRAMAPGLLVVGLFLIGGIYSIAATPNNATASNARSALIEEGKNIFLRGCSSCHGLNAEGGKVAPSLIGVGAASVDFQVATGRMPMGDMSVQAMRKKPVYNAQEIAALAAYVASLAPGPAIPTAEQLDYERDGNIAEGGELFRTNCAMCHNAAAQGGALTAGKYAPTLMGVEPVHIYEAMITGPQAMPVFGDRAITPEEKLSIIKWVKSVESEGNFAGASLGKVGPVTEGLVAWVVGIGSLIAIAVWLATKAR